MAAPSFAERRVGDGRLFEDCRVGMAHHRRRCFWWAVPWRRGSSPAAGVTAQRRGMHEPPSGRIDHEPMSQQPREPRAERSQVAADADGLSRRVRLVRDFSFEGAHRLPNVPAGHKCSRLHGHSFRVQVICEGEIDPVTGWLIDFAEIKRVFAPVLAQLDHQYLNDIEGLDNPTAENIARWIWSRLKPALPSLAQINVAESGSSRCEYRG